MCLLRSSGNQIPERIRSVGVISGARPVNDRGEGEGRRRGTYEEKRGKREVSGGASAGPGSQSEQPR